MPREFYYFYKDKALSVMKEKIAVCFGEFLGTFLLVFTGISAIAVTVLFDALSGLEVAAVWGLGVTLAIYATRHLSCAHLNPAVSLGMVMAGRMRPRLLLSYWASQLFGGIIAGVTVYSIFKLPISAFENANHIVRGEPESVRTAMIFGEYFPNPAVTAPWLEISWQSAMFVEGIGTFLLVTMIFMLTEGCNVGRPSEGSSPVFIGGTVAAIIAITAPLTQTGINPARDFGPRFIAFLAGWGSIAIPGPKGGVFWVYVLAPLIGGAVAALFFRFVVAPLMSARSHTLDCACAESRIEGPA